jgi:hypothetical protein
MCCGTRSLDYFVGAGEQCREHLQAERFGRLEIDDERARQKGRLDETSHHPDDPVPLLKKILSQVAECLPSSLWDGGPCAHTDLGEASSGKKGRHDGGRFGRRDAYTGDGFRKSKGTWLSPCAFLGYR